MTEIPMGTEIFSIWGGYKDDFIPKFLIWESDDGDFLPNYLFGEGMGMKWNLHPLSIFLF